ncbi:MAG: molecular chaperone TorD family protein [Caldilinea sp.]|jgi:DMSO reductase family type II enzyme chaperone|uniref:TorD/DmsD family molecular chaperone n=1 Tax=Caldilinea sp. TaxID=2293560 RepID=UPI003096E1A0
MDKIESLATQSGVDGALQRRAEQAVYRAQVYAFLSVVHLYPSENWSEDLPLAAAAVARVEGAPPWPEVQPMTQEALQMAYLRAFGAAGSLCYETEYGLPHEYRQAQELADIAGFYRAFGFTLGGAVRERPDHLAVELEFMHVLALKEAHALLTGVAEQAELCVDAQAKFLGDHLGVWIELFAQSLALNTREAPYLPLARFTVEWVRADAARLGVQLASRNRKEVNHTPFDPDFSCAACPMVDLLR